MRYGENPHQKAALYLEPNAAKMPCVSTSEQLQGKELSYNNIADADAALDCCLAFSKDPHCCVIVKHANPCGVSVSKTSLKEAYEKAFQTDPTSAFGGIIAVSSELDEATAQAIVDNQFVEVILAPVVSEKASEIVGKKKNVRLLKYTAPSSGSKESQKPQLEYKKIMGGLLVQDRDEEPAEIELKVVTKKQPTEEQMADLLFTWRVAQYVKSNAIVFGKNQMTYGVGAGQMSRVFSSRIACEKAAEVELDLKDSVMAR